MVSRTTSRQAISTHALREEGDGLRNGRYRQIHLFLPTPSARRATAMVAFIKRIAEISTHALREEGDLNNNDDGRMMFKFLPTPSARRATWVTSLL